MAEDKHFNEERQAPPLGVEDHQPTDKFAARGLVIVVAIGLFLGGMIAVYTYYRAERGPAPQEQEYPRPQ